MISCSLASVPPVPDVVSSFPLPRTPLQAQVGMGFCLLSVTWISTGTSNDMYRIEFIPLNRLLLSCPPLSCYLLTTFHQWPNLAASILSLCLICSTSLWPHCQSLRVFVSSYCVASRPLICSAAQGIALKHVLPLCGSHSPCNQIWLILQLRSSNALLPLQTLST